MRELGSFTARACSPAMCPGPARLHAPEATVHSRKPSSQRSYMQAVLGSAALRASSLGSFPPRLSGAFCRLLLRAPQHTGVAMTAIECKRAFAELPGSARAAPALEGPPKTMKLRAIAAPCVPSSDEGVAADDGAEAPAALAAAPAPSSPPRGRASDSPGSGRSSSSASSSSSSSSSSSAGADSNDEVAGDAGGEDRRVRIPKEIIGVPVRVERNKKGGRRSLGSE